MATALNNAAPSAPPVAPHAPDAPSSAFLSDEEILGIFDETAGSPASARDNSGQAADDSFWDSDSSNSDAHSSFGRVRAPANARVAQGPHVAQGGAKPWGRSQPNSDAPPNTPQSSADRTEHTTDPLPINASATGNENPDVFNSTSATEPEPAPLPEWLAEVTAAAPSAAPELANLWQRANALDTFDRAFYGADASAQQQLITQLYSDDPSAFRAMVSAAAQLLEGSATDISSRNGSHASRDHAPANNFGTRVAPASVPAQLTSHTASRDAGATTRSASQFQNESVAQVHTEARNVSARQSFGEGGDRPEAFPRHTASPGRGNDSPVGATHPQVPIPQSGTGDPSYSPPSRANNFAAAPPGGSLGARSTNLNSNFSSGPDAAHQNPQAPAWGRSSEGANHSGAAQSAAQNFNPAAYAQFEQSTNDAVVTDVSRAIERALDRALPGGIADGARRRIATDTLTEVHTALRGDRQLASQVAGMLRGSFVAGGSDSRAGNSSGAQVAPRFDNATRDAIARLIATRARGVVPEAARRVIGEWTGSVLSAHRERTSRQQSANARVDVVGSQASAPVHRRAVKSADINYRATSDEDILSW